MFTMQPHLDTQLSHLHQHGHQPVHSSSVTFADPFQPMGVAHGLSSGHVLGSIAESVEQHFHATRQQPTITSPIKNIISTLVAFICSPPVLSLNVARACLMCIPFTLDITYSLPLSHYSYLRLIVHLPGCISPFFSFDI